MMTQPARKLKCPTLLNTFGAICTSSSEGFPKQRLLLVLAYVILSFYHSASGRIVESSGADSTYTAIQTSSVSSPKNHTEKQITHAFNHSLNQSTIISFSGNSSLSEDMCKPRTLTPALWSEFNLNDYLLNYPGGKDISLEQLAINSKLLNFDCGISKMCYAGQLCSPVIGKDWYILVAAQEWNSYMNIMYQSIGFAMTMMQGIIPSMIKDFFPDNNDDWAIAKAYLTFFSNFAKVHPTEGHLSITKWWMQMVQGQIGFAAGEANIMDYSIVPDPVNQHDKWTNFIYQLSKNQDLIQSQLTKNSEEIVSSGISTEEGIYGALKDGEFLIDHVHYASFINFAASEQREMKLSIELHLLAAIWEKQKYFIVRGSDSCKFSGPNGAFGKPDQLSYCGPDNIMMNIVKVEGKNRLKTKIYNGRQVLDKYNFTTGFLTERAWSCQQKNKEFELDVWNSSTPIRLDSQCSFNLPVCDLTTPEIRDLRKDGKSIVEICRDIIGLPL